MEELKQKVWEMEFLSMDSEFLGCSCSESELILGDCGSSGPAVINMGDCGPNSH